MKIIFAIFFLVSFQLIQGQNYFNKLYPQELVNLARDVVEKDSTFYVLSQNISNTFRGIRCYKLNIQGDTLWVKDYVDSSKVFYSQRIVDIDSALYVFGSYNDTDDIVSSQFFLTKFSYDFEFDWIKNYGNSYFESGIELIKTNDNGYLMVGSSVAQDGAYENFFVVKTDSLGVEEWTRRFDYDWFSRITGVVQLDDNSYIASGYSFIPPTPDTNAHYDFMMLKFDEDGNELWRKMIGNTDDQTSLVVNLLSDNTLLLTGSSQIPNMINYRGYLAKADFNGNLIWEKSHQEFATLFVSCKPLVNNDLSFLLPVRATNDQSKTFSLLLKFDLNGNLLWERNFFSTFSSNTNFYSDISALKRTNDGGYIFCGSALDSNNVQRPWVVKTDCFGCDSMLCYYPDSICDIYDCSLYPINADFTIYDLVINVANPGEDTVAFVNPYGNTTNRVWDFGDGSVAYTDSTVSHVYADTGTYEVQLIVYHGMCSDTMTQKVNVINIAGLDESVSPFGGGLRGRIFPNPSKGSFTIDSPFSNDTPLILIDSQGKMIYNANLKKGKNEFILNLAPGVYVLECGTQRERIAIY